MGLHDFYKAVMKERADLRAKETHDIMNAISRSKKKQHNWNEFTEHMNLLAIRLGLSESFVLEFIEKNKIQIDTLREEFERVRSVVHALIYDAYDDMANYLHTNFTPFVGVQRILDMQRWSLSKKALVFNKDAFPTAKLVKMLTDAGVNDDTLLKIDESNAWKAQVFIDAIKHGEDSVRPIVDTWKGTEIFRHLRTKKECFNVEQADKVRKDIPTTRAYGDEISDSKIFITSDQEPSTRGSVVKVQLCPFHATELFHIVKTIASFPSLSTDMENILAVQLNHPLSPLFGRTWTELNKALASIQLRASDGTSEVLKFLSSHMTDLRYDHKAQTISLKLGADTFKVTSVLIPMADIKPRTQKQTSPPPEKVPQSVAPPADDESVENEHEPKDCIRVPCSECSGKPSFLFVRTAGEAAKIMLFETEKDFAQAFPSSVFDDAKGLLTMKMKLGYKIDIMPTSISLSESGSSSLSVNGFAVAPSSKSDKKLNASDVLAISFIIPPPNTLEEYVSRLKYYSSSHQEQMKLKIADEKEKSILETRLAGMKEVVRIIFLNETKTCPCEECMFPVDEGDEDWDDDEEDDEDDDGEEDDIHDMTPTNMEELEELILYSKIVELSSMLNAAKKKLRKTKERFDVELDKIKRDSTLKVQEEYTKLLDALEYATNEFPSDAEDIAAYVKSSSIPNINEWLTTDDFLVQRPAFKPEIMKELMTESLIPLDPDELKKVVRNSKKDSLIAWYNTMAVPKEDEEFEPKEIRESLTAKMKLELIGICMTNTSTLVQTTQTMAQRFSNIIQKTDKGAMFNTFIKPNFASAWTKTFGEKKVLKNPGPEKIIAFFNELLSSASLIPEATDALIRKMTNTGYPTKQEYEQHVDASGDNALSFEMFLLLPSHSHVIGEEISFYRMKLWLENEGSEFLTPYRLDSDWDFTLQEEKKLLKKARSKYDTLLSTGPLTAVSVAPVLDMLAIPKMELQAYEWTDILNAYERVAPKTKAVTLGAPFDNTKAVLYIGPEQRVKFKADIKNESSGGTITCGNTIIRYGHGETLPVAAASNASTASSAVQPPVPVVAQSPSGFSPPTQSVGEIVISNILPFSHEDLVQKYKDNKIKDAWFDDWVALYEGKSRSEQEMINAQYAALSDNPVDKEIAQWFHAQIKTVDLQDIMRFLRRFRTQKYAKEDLRKSLKVAEQKRAEAVKALLIMTDNCKILSSTT